MTSLVSPFLANAFDIPLPSSSLIEALVQIQHIPIHLRSPTSAPQSYITGIVVYFFGFSAMDFNISISPPKVYSFLNPLQSIMPKRMSKTHSTARGSPPPPSSSPYSHLPETHIPHISVPLIVPLKDVIMTYDEMDRRAGAVVQSLE